MGQKVIKWLTSMTKSMTGFAALTGEHDGYSWGWDIRSVNARGLDVRLRVPDWIDGLEAAVRPIVQKAAIRGNINLTLRIQRENDAGAAVIDPDALRHALTMVCDVEAAAMSKGLTLAPTSGAAILAIRGVVTAASVADDTTALRAALMAQLPELLASFNEMRASEGTSLASILAGQFDQIETLTTNAVKEAAIRKDQMAENLQSNLARVLENSDGADADRVAQELAIIGVKTDVTEEIDRLHAHVAAARDLLASDGAIGRKLDFLSQEFNREANTLCSKAQSTDLTAIGLDLKAVIDQMREQVQNVE